MNTIVVWQRLKKNLTKHFNIIKMEISTKVRAIKDGIVIANYISGLDSTIATALESHFKDKLAKVQKKTTVPIESSLIPKSKGEFTHIIAVSTERTLDPETIAETSAVLEELHKALIEAALLPTHILNVLKDLKPIAPADSDGRAA